MKKQPFVIEGDLWLRCQEGGFASDAWVLKQRELEGFTEQLGVAITNIHLGDVELDDLVVDHFGAVRQEGLGDRHIGQVRITIERLKE